MNKKGFRLPQKHEQILVEGKPCNHSGCLNHISHPCEGCGRIAGKENPHIGSEFEDYNTSQVEDFDNAVEMLCNEIKELEDMNKSLMSSLGEHMEIISKIKKRHITDSKIIRKMKKTLKSIADNTCCESCQEASLVARSCLVKLNDKKS